MTNFNTLLKKLGLFIIAIFLCSLSAYAQPNFSKSFSPSTIAPGAITTLTFTIDNTSNGSPIGAVAFTDNFPAGMTIADPPNIVHDCGVSAVVTAVAGGTSISMTDGQVLSGQFCTISVNVTATVTGTNTSGDLTFNTPGTPGPVTGPSATLTVDNTQPLLTKSFSPAMIDVGERSTLTFTIDNPAGGSNIFLLFNNIIDNLPNGMVVADPANVSGTCPNLATGVTAVPGSSLITATALGVITAGSSCSFSVDVIGTTSGTLDNVTNDFTYQGQFGISTIATGKAAASLEVVQHPLHITKEFTNDPVAPGGIANLEITIQNRDRDFEATNVLFSDVLDANLTGLVAAAPLPTNPCGTGSSIVGTSTIVLMGGNIPAEGSCTFTIAVQVPSNAASGSFENETSNVSATINSTTVIGNTASDLLFVNPAPSLTKTFLDNPVGPGSTTELEFTITNNSPDHTLTNATFYDQFDVIMKTGFNVPAPGSCGAGSTFSFTPFFDPGSDSPVIPATLTVNNANLAAGASCTFSITLNVDGSAAGGTYPNVTSEITGTIDGLSYTGNPATDDLIVLSAPAITKSFQSSPLPGETVDLLFTISLDENAPSDATAMTFTDDLTAMTSIPGLTVSAGGTQTDICGEGSSVSVNGANNEITFAGGTLSPGGNCSFTVTIQTPANAAVGSHTNTTSTLSAMVVGTNVNGPAGVADLLINPFTFTKEFTPNSILPGGTSQLKFSIALDANSPTDATTTIFSDDFHAFLNGTRGTLVSNTCGGSFIGSTTNATSIFFVGTDPISPGSSCEIIFDIQTNAGAPNGDHTNSTSVLSAIIDGNNHSFALATDDLTINDELLSITKSFTDDPVPPGGDVTLEFTIENLDATNAISDIAFTDDLNAVIPTLAATSADFNDCGGMASGFPTTNFSYSGGSLPAGGSCTIRIICNVPVAATAGLHLNTTSTVTGMVGAVPVNGPPATDNLQIDQLRLSKAFGGPVVAGCTTTLSFTIDNFDAANSLTDLNFTDDLDAVLTGLVMVGDPISNTCGGSSAISGTSTIAFTGGEVAPSGSCSFQVTVQVPCNAAAGTYQNVTTELRTGTNAFVGIIGEDELVVSATNAAPTASNPGAITAQCTAPAPDISVVNDEADDCTANPVVAYVGDVSDGNTCPEVITRTYSVTDDCGQSINVTQQITIHDTMNPTASNPAGINAQCTAPAPDISVVNDEADNCGTPTVTFVNDVSDGNTCPEVITRTYKVEDACGNSINVTQQITIHDTMNPTASNPAGISAQCTAPAPDVSVVNDEADNCGTPTVTFVNDVSDGNSCPEIITRTYKVEDACGNSINVTQLITIEDTMNPTASNPAGISAQCTAPAPDISVVNDEADNCGTPTVTFVNDVSDGNSCPEIITRTYKVEDACGNSINVTQLITIEDTMNPTASNPAAINAECMAPYPDVTVVTDEADNCGAPMVTHVSDVSDNMTCPETITRTYKVEDACGNSINVTQIITVNDVTVPTPSCNDISAALDAYGMTNYTAAELNNNSSDNCSGTLNFTASPSYLDCSNIGENNVTLTAEDDCGNTASCVSTVTVTNDVDISISDVSKLEGSPSGFNVYVFTVTRSNNNCVTTVDYATSDGSATTGDSDYVGKSGTLTFPAMGGLTRSVVVQVIKDELVETDENFYVDLSNASAGSTITVAQGEGTIQNDDGANLTIDDVSIQEGTSAGFGTSTLTFTVTLDADVVGGFSVDYATADGTAEDENGDIDYIKTSNTLTFAGNAGETQTIDVPIWHDNKVELDENFFVNLSNVVGSASVTILDGQGEGTIENDDSASLSIEDLSPVNEGGDGETNTYSLAVTLDAPVDVFFTVDYATADNTATIGDNDYDSASGVLYFSGNNGEKQYIDITINGDCKAELDESFFINLSGIHASGRDVSISDAQGDATILNDDSQPTFSSCPNAQLVHVDATCYHKVVDYTVFPTFNTNCLGATNIVQDPPQGTSIGLGTHLLTITGTDSGGATATCSFNIFVEDNLAPTAQCQDLNVFLNPNTSSTISPVQIDAGSFDNCSAVTLVSVMPNTFDCNNIGTNTVTLTVQDAQGLTDNCTATVTVNGIAVVCYADTDGDSYGDAANQQTFCLTCGTGYVDDASDCDDSDAAVNPGATEVCDGIDNNCDGVIDESADADGDGVSICDGDCDDNDPNNFPGNVEICDGFDNNCDGVIDEGFDVDGDGYTTCEGDCDDNEITIFPGSPEVCDGIDNNCDGYIDEGFDLDGDGYSICENDCDDSDASINPGAAEVCDGVDNDCDGFIDNGAGGIFVGNVILTTQNEVNQFSPCINTIVGSLIINGNGITDLSALGNLIEVTVDVVVTSTSLPDLDGLDNLATIGNELTITNNGPLAALDALGNLTTLGAGLNVIANNALGDLIGLGGLTTINSTLNVISNANLTSLIGLESITVVAGNLNILLNPVLTDCCPIYTLLDSGGVVLSILIFGNDTGCDSEPVILTTCAPSGAIISNPGTGNAALTAPQTLGEFKLYPNPTSGVLNLPIEFLENSAIPVEYSILSVQGKEVQRGKLQAGMHILDVSELEAGIYFLLMYHGNEKFGQRFSKIGN